MKTIVFDEIFSTNEYAETRDFAEDTVIIAKRQTGGKGTKGRSFSSHEGGVYLSLVRLYPCKTDEAFSIMVASCMAVVKTLESYGVSPKIKWANDVYLNGKKICGILIKNSFEGENIKKSITGIGVNVNNDLPDDLKDIAVNLKSLIGEVDTEEFAKRLVENLYRKFTIEEYKSYNMVLGKEITVISGEKSYKVVAKDISDDGNLILEDGRKLSYGEISVKFV